MTLRYPSQFWGPNEANVEDAQHRWTKRKLEREEIFFRAFRNAEFDVCELSLSSMTMKTAQGDCPYIGVPAFLSRAFPSHLDLHPHG